MDGGEVNMDLKPEQVMLNTRILSIHRASIRRKLDKMRPGTHEYQLTLQEVRDTQVLLNLMADHDLAQLDGAA